MALSDELTNEARSIPELIQDVKDTLEWADQLGVRVAPSNWTNQVVAKLEKIQAADSEAEKQKLFIQLYKDPVESQHNISDLMFLTVLRRNIGTQDPDILVSKLHKALKGPGSVRQETANNTTFRDIRFELNLVANLNSSGFQARLADPHPDILAKRRNLQAAIEAKRLFSKEQLEKRLVEAGGQLKRQEDRMLRVVYIDVTRSYTEGKLHLQGSRAKVAQDLDQGMKKLAEETILPLLSKHRMSQVDAVVLVYQDYFEPPKGDYILRSITQHLVVINQAAHPDCSPTAALVPRYRRRQAISFFRKLGLNGVIGIN